MNGPQPICACCEKPTTFNKPICDECLLITGATPVEYCALCNAALDADSPILAAERGVHMTKAGGYAGRCTA